MSTVDEILQRWPIHSMLARLGIDVPPAGKFCSPFRPDNNPSCAIYKDTLHDWSTGKYYDSIAVFAEVKGLSNSEAVKQLAAELPGRLPKKAEKQRVLQIPPLHYDAEKARAAASSRGLTPLSTEFAGFTLGTLGFADIGGFPCWVLSDASNLVAEARRIDGNPFPAYKGIGERKGHTLAGSKKTWPVGLKPRKGKVTREHRIVMVEGGPDYLAACDLLAVANQEFLPVAMLGASCLTIHSEALQMMHDRDVLILSHPDDPGIRAGQAWRSQLSKAGARVRLMQLSGGDLNDLVARDGAEEIAKEILQ
jgi:DNA primase